MTPAAAASTASTTAAAAATTAATATTAAGLITCLPLSSRSRRVSISATISASSSRGQRLLRDPEELVLAR